MPDTTSPLDRSEGVTDAERYLTRLARRSFLSLWSYPGVYRDQGDTVRGGDGKEVCDLLVVFDNHILIFSDKDCAFPDTGDLDLDWSRWYRRAVIGNAKQIWTAERWIRRYPDRLFLDRKCQQPFPIDLPPSDTMKIHRIIVAHRASERCKKELGGSGSLMIMPNIIGECHIASRADGGVPFAIGQVDPKHGYYHVLDDTTLDILLNTLDTITDFVGYLEKKERFIASGKLGGAAGEEELLAFYLGKLNAQQEHDFIVPLGTDKIFIDENWWSDFENSPERKAQIEANKVSYFWDELVEHFLSHTYAGTHTFTPHTALADHERVYRFLARESRTRRRMMSAALLELMVKTPATKHARRVIGSSKTSDPVYVFLLLPQPQSCSFEEYQEVRRQHLADCCMITKTEVPSATDIIGIATESGQPGGWSQDVIYLDAREWTPEQQKEAEELRAEFHHNKVMGNQQMFRGVVQEYPIVSVSSSATRKQGTTSVMKGSDRNKPCPCGSGRKRKQCCG